MKKAPARQAKPVPFVKLHGAGNDILVVQSRDLPKRAKAAFLRRMAHRQLGIGCDQLIEVLSLRPLRVQVWNGDGTKAEMCANGSRVFLFLAARNGWLPPGKEIPLEISGRPYVGFRRKDGFELCLGAPKLLGKGSVRLLGQSIPFQEVNVGNPHAVVLVGSGEGRWSLPEDYTLAAYGSRVEVHPRFPRKTNVEFVRRWRKLGRRISAEVDVWERGAGATLSCGSGAVAVAAVLREITGITLVSVRMTDFTLRIRFEGDKAYLSGPCALVAEGRYFA